MFIDTHSHLNFSQFDEDLTEVIDRACSAGINQMIVVGSDINNSKKAIKMANENDHLFATVGLHPTEVDLHWQKKMEEISETLINCHPEFISGSDDKILKQVQHDGGEKKIVAIGEIGLDYHKKNQLIKKEVKIEALEAFIDLANKYSLPVIFHCREAIEDFFDTLKPKKSHVKGVIHCFQGDMVDAKRAFDLGLLISYTGMITFRKDYDEVIKYAPLDNLMIETDCPFLTPEPYRGERNEPAYVVEVARRIAEIKDIPYFKVAEQTTKNAIKLFDLENL